MATIQNADTKGKILKGLIDKAIEARKPFIDTGKKICAYAYDETVPFDYGIPDSVKFFKAKVAKTAEYIEVVGPSLYQNVPDRRVTPKKWANDVAKARAEVMQDYLNYTPKETDLSAHSRRCINDALTYGAGAMWTGFNSDKKVIQSVQDSIENVLCDPGAGRWEEMSWIARVRKQPKWKMMNEYPEQKEKIEKCGKEPTDEITYYIVYMKVGLENYNVGKPLNTDAQGMPVIDNSPKRYCVLEDGVLIEEDMWEIPFYLDAAWPVELLYYREKPGQVWPVSPLQPGLGFQEALNYAFTFFMAKVRTASNDLIAVAPGVNTDEINAAVRGVGLRLIPLDGSAANGDAQDIHKLLQQWSFDPRADDFVKIITIIERAFERATGLTEFLATGSTDRQLRSAEEARMKDQNSRTRFEDMRVKTELHQSNVARREAQAARFLLDPQHIAPILGQEAAAVWGKLMPPLKVQEERLTEQAMQQQLPPEQAAMFIQQNTITDGVVYEEWLLESEYDIEAGSTRRKDISQQIDAANEFMKQGVPAMMPIGPPIFPAVLAGMVAWSELNGMPEGFTTAIKSASLAVQQQQQMMMQQQQMAMAGGIPPPPDAAAPGVVPPPNPGPPQGM